MQFTVKLLDELVLVVPGEYSSVHDKSCDRVHDAARLRARRDTKNQIVVILGL